MEIIGNSNTSKIIEKKFIDRVFNQEARNIFKAQDRVLASSKIDTETNHIIRSKRRYTVSGSDLEITHAMVSRFIDMRNIRGLKRKAIPNHNKVIYTHFNYIINQMAFGLTQDVKDLIAKEYKIGN